MQVCDYTQRLRRTRSQKAVRVAGLVLLAGLAFATQRVEAASNALLDITHATLPGDKQQLAR